MNLSYLSPAQLRHAAALKERLAALQKEFANVLGAPATPPAPAAAPKKKKWKMSSAGRANIVAAQKARWAKIKGRQLSVKPAKKTKGKISAAGRKRLAQLAKARWAKARAAGQKTLAA
jgi:hypothetical protein